MAFALADDEISCSQDLFMSPVLKLDDLKNFKTAIDDFEELEFPHDETLYKKDCRDDSQVVPDRDFDNDNPFNQHDVQFEKNLHNDDIQMCHSDLKTDLSDAELCDESPKIQSKASKKSKLNVDASQSKRKLHFGYDEETNKQNDYVSDLDGVWVECVLCKKWRHLRDIKDPVNIEEDWNCSMNKNFNYNTCFADEEEWTESMEEKCIYNKFTCGSVVWVKTPKRPWWPGIVDCDPDTEEFFLIDKKSKIVTHYHVVCWDDSVWRYWIPAKNVMTFDESEKTYRSTYYRKRNYFSKIKFAKEQAVEAIKLDVKERIENFGFAALYQGSNKGKTKKRIVDPDFIPNKSAKRLKIESANATSSNNLKITFKKNSDDCIEVRVGKSSEENELKSFEVTDGATINESRKEDFSDGDIEQMVPDIASTVAIDSIGNKELVEDVTQHAITQIVIDEEATSTCHQSPMSCEE